MLIVGETQVYNPDTLGNRECNDVKTGKKCMIDTLWGKMKIDAPGGKYE